MCVIYRKMKVFRKKVAKKFAITEILTKFRAYYFTMGITNHIKN